MFGIGLSLVLLGFILVFFLPEICVKNSLIFQLTGLAVFLIGTWLIKKSTEKEINSLVTEKKLKKQKLKKYGIRIQVNLEDCNLLSTKEITTKPSTDIMYAQAFNALLDSKNSVKLEEKNRYFITFKMKEQGINKLLISEPITINEDVLKIKLYIKKKTSIYYDKNTGDFFFDLSFLYD